MRNRSSSFFGQINITAQAWVDSFFTSENSSFSILAEKVLLFSLWVIGIVQWGNFLNWGKINFYLGDWFDITGPRLFYTRNVLLNGSLPLHVAVENGWKGVTDRFLSIPDILLSPQILLMKFVSPGLFVLFNGLILFSIGYVGLLLIRRKYRLSMATFTVVFFLFNFNGHISAHLAVGHVTWMGYFLLPFFVLLVLDTPRKDYLWPWVMKITLISVLIFLQGSFHLFVTCLIFLGVLLLFSRTYRKASFLAILFSTLGSMIRIAPIAITSRDLKVGFLSGFTNIGEFMSGLVRLIQPTSIKNK